MGKASAAIDIPAPPNEVWQLIGGFNSLPDWLSYIPKSELSEDGRVRQVADLKGETIVERLKAFDNTARSYSYSIIQARFPVTGYLSTLQVKPAADGKGSRVEWNGVPHSEYRKHSPLAYSIFQREFSPSWLNQVTDCCLNDMRCVRGGLTLGVHKIPFRVFSSTKA